jgi:hypothetical protein
MMVADFEDAWDAIARHKQLNGRGNFMFARQAMGVLEFVSRLCSSDATGGALLDLSAALKRIEPRYFTTLPGRCARPGFDRRNNAFDWMLPFGSVADQGRELLWAMFDLVRHGQAHQGQQIMVQLRGGDTFGISLTGASYGRTLRSGRLRAAARHTPESLDPARRGEARCSPRDALPRLQAGNHRCSVT